MGLTSSLSQWPLIGGFFNNPVVPVIRFSGIISDTQKRAAISHEKYRTLIDKAFNMPNLKAVGLLINCPGGSPAQTELISSHIRRKATEKNVPVYAFIEDVAASGGYWLACTADEIYSANSAIVGSIGVITSGFGFDKFIKKNDVDRRIYTEGKEKSMLDPFLPEKDADVKRLKAIQKDLHKLFIDWVKSRREDKLKGTKASLFEGQIWTAETAIDKGIIDYIGECDSILEKKFGDKVVRIDLQMNKRLFSLPFGILRTSTQDNNLPEQALELLEEKSLWAKYGF